MELLVWFLWNAHRSQYSTLIGREREGEWWWCGKFARFFPCDFDYVMFLFMWFFGYFVLNILSTCRLKDKSLYLRYYLPKWCESISIQCVRFFSLLCWCCCCCCIQYTAINWWFLVQFIEQKRSRYHGRQNGTHTQNR